MWELSFDPFSSLLRTVNSPRVVLQFFHLHLLRLEDLAQHVVHQAQN